MTVQEPEQGPTLAEAVGRVVMAASWLEYEVGRAVVVLSGSSATTLLIAGQSYATLRDMLRNVARVADDADRIALLALVTRIGDLMDKRNGVVHGQWMPGRDAGVHVAERQQRRSYSETPWTVPELLDLAEQLRTTGDELLVLSQDTSVALYPDQEWFW
jgi:hypothetical protein